MISNQVNETTYEHGLLNMRQNDLRPRKTWVNQNGKIQNKKVSIFNKQTVVNELENKVAKIEEEYKARIAELEAKYPVTPPKQREAILVELKSFSANIALCLEDTQKLLEDTTFTWVAMEEIDNFVAVNEELQKNQQELDAVTAVMKDMPPLKHMLKMGENKRLQAKQQQLCT